MINSSYKTGIYRLKKRKENEIKETKICPQGNSRRLGMIHAMVGCTTSVNPFARKREEKWEENEGVEGKFVLS